MNDINTLYSHQMELFYWSLTMMGVCTGVLCMTLWVCAQHLAEAMVKNGAVQAEARSVSSDLVQKLKDAEDRFASIVCEMRLRTERAVLLSRHWARVASAGWTNSPCLDDATGD